MVEESQRSHGRLARWDMRLMQFNFTIEHRKGALHKVPGALSRNIFAELKAGESAQNSDCWFKKIMNRVKETPEDYPLWRIGQENLFKTKTDKFGPYEWKLVVPKELRRGICKECHDEPTAGHMGMFKTLGRVKEHYYWPRMRWDIKNYVRNCEVCRAHKVSQERPVGKMGERVVSSTWKVVSIDLVGPLPRTAKGNKYVLVACDTFSKWVTIVPLRNATAETVHKEMKEKIILAYGAPKAIIMDNGVQFKSKKVQDLLDGHGIQKWYTPLYHPRANPTERVNRIIKTMISSYVEHEHQKWDKWLPEFQFALRTAFHESTAYRPSDLFLAHHMTLHNHPVVEEGQDMTGIDEFVERKVAKIEEKIKKQEKIC